MRTSPFTLLAITLAVSVPMLGAVVQAADPMAGTWKLNLSKSKFDNHPGPKSLRFTWRTTVTCFASG
jgi:hypothetical protein